MKRLIILSFFVLLPGFVFAQREIPKFKPEYELKRRLHFGFTLGVNTAGFNIHRNNTAMGLYADMPKLSAGFHVGIVSDLRLFRNLNLRFLPTVTFVQRHLAYYNKKNEIYKNDANGVYANMSFESTFLEFPLLLKYKAKRVNNHIVYVVAGPVFSTDLAAYKKLNRDDGIYVRLESIDFGYEIGVGYDRFLPFFKLSTELKFYSGFSNMLSPDAIKDTDIDTQMFVDAVEKITSYGFKLSFHFE